jgi:hypothetical protein
VVPAGIDLPGTRLAGENRRTRTRSTLMNEVSGRDSDFLLVDGTELTAMGWYLALFEDRAPAVAKAPVLLVRATGAMPPEHAPDESPVDWRSHRDDVSSIVAVPGSHFTMLEEHLDRTAEAVTVRLGRVS